MTEVGRFTERAAIQSFLRQGCSTNRLSTVADAMSLALTRGSAREKEAWSSIEKRRKQLVANKGLISHINYGVKPGHVQTDEERRSGIKYTTSASELVRASTNPVWGEVLYHLTRIHKPLKVLELGTCVGISGAYIASALKANAQGHLWTLEGSATSAALAQQTFDELGLSDWVTLGVGKFNKTLTPCLSAIDALDLVFVDGHHHGDSTVGYFGVIKPKLAPGAIAVFDDIDYSPSMEKAWMRITSGVSPDRFMRTRKKGFVIP